MTATVITFMNRVNGNFISLAMLSIMAVMVALGDERSTVQFKLFLWLLVLTFTELVLDIFSWSLNGKAGYEFPLTMVYLVYFTIQPVTTFLWALYADYQTFFDGRRLARLAIVLSPPLALHTAMVLASPFTGWAFHLDAANAYSRGSLFVVTMAVPFLYLGYTLLSTIAHWSRLASRSRFPLLIFAVPPAAGGIVQAMFFGVSLLWPGVSLSLLMVYLSIESELLVTDHLTGLNNRRSFDRYLSRKVKSLPADRLFAIFMLDLDGFKRINDRFGHAQGDEALAETAGVLRRCMHANDFIARYAGDEFVVVAELRKREDAAILRARIEESFNAFNRESGKPWRLSASVGASIREPGDSRPAGAIVAEADAMMYRAKTAGGG